MKKEKHIWGMGYTEILNIIDKLGSLLKTTKNAPFWSINLIKVASSIGRKVCLNKPSNSRSKLPKPIEYNDV